MNSHPSPGSTQTPPTSRPENEDDDPVGDNQPVTGSTDPDAPDAHSDDDSDEDSQGDSGESNSGAVRTGDDGGSAPRRSSDDPAEVPEEGPEGSDARPDDRLNDHQEEDFASGRAGRRPASDSKLPQHSRG